MIAQRGPGFSNHEPQSLFVIDDSAIVPELALNLFVRDEMAGLAGKEGEQPEGLRRQLDRFSGFAQFARPKVKFEDSEPQERCCAHFFCHLRTSRGKLLVHDYSCRESDLQGKGHSGGGGHIISELIIFQPVARSHRSHAKLTPQLWTARDKWFKVARIGLHSAGAHLQKNRDEREEGCASS
jgi:hypothetical protein